MANNFVGLFGNSQGTATQNKFTGLFSAATAPAQTGLPASKPVQATPIPNYFNGEGYSPATTIDTYSEKPFATVPMTIPKTFMSPQITVPIVDKTRTATTFDPTLPQKIDPNVLKTGHIADVQSSIKSALGGTTSQELDHIIPVALGGTYDMSNMRLEPDITGTKNTATDPIETKNWNDAIIGKISVVQALRNIASAKGITLTEDKALNNPVNQALLNTPSVLKPMAAVQNAVTGAAGAVKNFFTGLFGNKTAQTGTSSQTGTPISVPITQQGNEGSTMAIAPASPSLWDNIKSYAGSISSGQDIINKTGTAVITNPKSVAAGAGVAVENFGLGVAKAFVGATGLLGNKQAPAASQWLNDNQNALNQIAQQNFAGTPDKQTAYITGNIVGSILPYYLTGAAMTAGAEATAIPLLSNFGGALTASQASTIGTVIKEASNVVSFLGTGQIAHTDAQGSRWNQFLTDAATLAIFEGARFGWASLKGEMPLASAESKIAAMREQAKVKAIDTLNSYLPDEQQIDYKASDAEIKQGYLRAAKLNHPDVGGVTADMQKINGAYSYLASMAEKPTVAEVSTEPKTLAGNVETPTVPETTSETVPKETAVVSPAMETKYGVAPTETTSAIPKELQPLAEEAKKLQTPEQIAERQGFNSVQEYNDFLAKNKGSVMDQSASRMSDIKKIDEQIKTAQAENGKDTGIYNLKTGKNNLVDNSKLISQLEKLRQGEMEKLPSDLYVKDFYNQATKESKPLSNEIVKPKVAKLEKPAKEKYYIFNRDKYKYEVVPNAKPIDIVPNVDTFIHKGSDGEWTITEAKTGGFAGKGKTVSAAKADALKNFENAKNKQGLNPEQVVEAQVKRTMAGPGKLSPRYEGKVSVPEAPQEAINARAGSVSPSTLTGGIDKFIEQDVKVATKGIVGGVQKTWDTMLKMVSPTSRGPEAQKTASIMREGLGRMARDKEMVFQSLSKAKKLLDKYSPEQSLKIIDSIETGKPTEGFEQFTAIVRKALDERWAKIQDIKGTDAYIENYFPHIWEDPAKAKNTLTQFFGKRPLEGTKSYLKQRTIPTIKQGVELGLKPTSYNPVELVMARIADMDRFLMANDVWTQFKENGLRKFVKMGEKPPEGWIQVDDKIARSFQFSPIEKGMILRGNWYMPEKAASIVNNYLSPGLVGNPLYNGLRMVSNILNQVQLGMSGFHALFTSGDAVVSKTALDIQKIFTSPTLVGKAASLGKAITNPLTAPYLLFKNLVRGNALLHDYFRTNPQIPEMVDALERADGRVRMDSFYLNNAVNNFMKALRSGNYPGAVLRAPGAMIESAAKPIMQWLVPRQKLGVFSDLASDILKQAQDNGWSEEKTTLKLQEAWDSVDNRMGQLVYDNLFWKRAIKDLGMAATRSLGWNLGTFRELGGGVKGLVTEPFKAVVGNEAPVMNPKMAYTLALPYVIGLWGAIIYYLYNKKAPQTLLDYYYIPTGKIKPDGSEERIALPSYMKDLFAYKIEGLMTITNKINPEVSAIIDMLQNKDYYGTEIRNPNDTTVQQIGELFDYQATQFVPFTISNLINRQKAGDNSWNAYLQSFSGITPAPNYITKTPLQIEISNLYDKRFGGGVQTQAQTKASQLKTNIRTQYMLGNDTQANALLHQAVQQGIVKQNGIATFIKDADIPSDVKLFQQLPASDQEALLKNMQLLDLERYAWSANSTVKVHLSTLSGNAKTFVEMQQKGEVKSPVWKRGQLVQ